MTSTGITTGAPTIGAPTLAEVAGTDALTATGITSGAPTIGAPTLAEVAGTDALTASGITTGAPSLGTPTLAEVSTPTPPASLGVLTSVYRPIVLALINLTNPVRVASRTHYDAEGNFYLGTLLNFPDIVEQLPNLYYGAEDSQSVTLRIANPIDPGPGLLNWYQIADGEELRGKWVPLGLYDPSDGTETLYVGKISSYSIGDTVEIAVDMRQDALLETLLPRDVVTTDTFHETAMDVGQPISICLGIAYNVPLRNIKNDTVNHHYDYLIGYGPIEGIYQGLYNGVRRDGVLVSWAEYTVYDGTQASPYPGYAFIRFTREQRTFNGAFHNLTADVYGLTLGGAVREQNFATVIKHILSDSTWGLGDSVDSASFAAGAAQTPLHFCGGAISQKRSVRDVLNEMLAAIYGAHIFRGTDGEWEIHVPGTGSSVAVFGDQDGFYNNCRVTRISRPPVTEAVRKIIVEYDMESDSHDHPRGQLELDVHATFGVEKTYRSEFWKSSLTAQKIASYHYQRSVYDIQVSIEAGLEARGLRRGHIITVIHPDKPPLTTGKDFIIEKISRLPQSSGYRIDGREYNALLYSDVSMTLPSDFQPGSNTVSGPLALVGNLTLGDGESLPARITLTRAAGSGDIYVNAGKTAFNNTQSGFILGIDDTDGLAKLYVGTSTYYINWDGAKPIFKAAKFEVDANGKLIATEGDFSGKVTATEGEITGLLTVPSGGKILVGDEDNYVEISPTGIVQYIDGLGVVVYLPVSGDDPVFSGQLIDRTPWTTKDADFTASSGIRYKIDTSANTVTMELPFSPNVNDKVCWMDLQRTFSDYSFFIDPNGQKFEGDDFTGDVVEVNVSGMNGTIEWVGADYGWKIVTIA